MTVVRQPQRRAASRRLMRGCPEKKRRIESGPIASIRERITGRLIGLFACFPFCGTKLY